VRRCQDKVSGGSRRVGSFQVVANLDAVGLGTVCDAPSLNKYD
jgi:hypothetical protein